MMKKRKKLWMSALLASPLLLTSCGIVDFPTTFFPSRSTSSEEISSGEISRQESISYGSVSHDYSLSEGGYYEPSLSSFQNMSLSHYGEYGTLGSGNMPSLGKPKLLVIPVYFAGDAAPSASELDSIQKAFFGESSDTGWESLSSYYQKSSYGLLDIEGVVTPPFQYSLSASAFQIAFELEENRSGHKDTTDLLIEATNWAKKNHYFDASFDTDKDGFLDGVDLIYFTDKTEKDNSNLWWAFTTNNSKNSNKANASSPVPYRYFWSPMSMIENGYYSPNIDTHTLIHETGHMMGIDDYYSYDRTTIGGTERYSESPCAMVDMMDCNVGDHNAYSKMLMGWVSPKVVLGEGSFSITLNSFTDTGEFLLIPSGSWNGTPYDEYMILQYYTPTGLNKKDSNGYKEYSSIAYGHGGTYASTGLQAFHVDSRVVSYDAKMVKTPFSSDPMYSNLRYSEDPLTVQKEHSDGSYTINLGIAASNTGSYSIDVKKSDISTGELTYGSKNRLITFLPANGTSAFLNPGFEKLFGSSTLLMNAFSSSVYTNEKMAACYQNNGKFNNGSSFPYRFEVTAQSSSSITISFTHL